MLYHLTNPENTTDILSTGLRPSNYRDSTDPLIVAENTRDRLLDRYARKKYGPEYPSRRDGVFFYTDPVFAVTEADKTGADILAVDEADIGGGDATLFSADRMEVEDLFARIHEGLYDGTVTNPSYNRGVVESESQRIIDESFREWTGDSNASREVWCSYVVRADAVSQFE